MSNLSDIGNLMHLHLTYIRPGKRTKFSDFLIISTAQTLKRLGGRNWIPVIVKETGEDKYKIIGNYFMYVVAKEAGLEKIWCIIADDNPETEQLVKVLAGEKTPQLNLSTATKDEIQSTLEYLNQKDPTLFKGVKLTLLLDRIDEAPRQYWKSLDPITRLKCKVNKGRRLDALEEVFYLTPEPQPIPNLKDLTLKELQAIARSQGIPCYTKRNKKELLKLLST